MFELHRRERIAFLAKLGDARLGRIKVGLGRSEITHFQEKGERSGEAKTHLDRTDASGSLLLRSCTTHVDTSGNQFRPT